MIVDLDPVLDLWSISCLFVWLSVCLLATLRKNCWTDLHKNFTTSVDKEEFIKCGSYLSKNWSDLHENFIANVTLNKKVPIRLWKSPGSEVRIRSPDPYPDSGCGLRIRTRFALAEVCALQVLLFCTLLVCVTLLCAVHDDSNMCEWSLSLTDMGRACERRKKPSGANGSGAMSERCRNDWTGAERSVERSRAERGADHGGLNRALITLA